MDVQIASVAPGLCATVNYATIPCTAEWICKGLNSDVLSARERLVTGTACVDNGNMQMWLAGEVLEWRYFDENGVNTSHASLRRVP
jgi:hypothetical protein